MDFAEAPQLVDLHDALLVELQHGQEAHHDLDPVEQVPGQVAEGNRASSGNLVDQGSHRVGHTDSDGGDVFGVDMERGPGRQGPEAGRTDVVDRDPFEDVRGQVKKAVLDPGLPGPRQGRVGGQATQHDRRVLERLALQQPGQQEVPLLPQAELVVLVHAPVGRQQPPGLQLDEDRRDEQEFGGHLQVARVQAL